MELLIDFMLVLGLIGVIITPIILFIHVCQTSKWLNRIYNKLTDYE